MQPTSALLAEVSTYGNGTEAFYLVAAALIPVLAGIGYFNLRSLDASSSIDWVEIKKVIGPPVAWSRWVVGTLYVTTLGLIVGLLTIAAALSGEVVCLVVLYQGRAATWQAVFVAIGLGVSLLTIVGAVVSWVAANSLKAYTDRCAASAVIGRGTAELLEEARGRGPEALSADEHEQKRRAARAALRDAGRGT